MAKALENPQQKRALFLRVIASICNKAFDMVLNKIAEDPLHSSFPNISYDGPGSMQNQLNESFPQSMRHQYSIASSSSQLEMNANYHQHHQHHHQNHHHQQQQQPPPPQLQPSAPFSNVQQMQIRQLQVQLQPPPDQSRSLRESSNPLIQSGLFNLSQIINNAGGANALTADYLKLILNFIGYTDQSAIDIIRAVDTLMSYGLINNTPSMTLNSIMTCLQNTASSSTSTLNAMAAAAAASLAAAANNSPLSSSIPPPQAVPLPNQPNVGINPMNTIRSPAAMAALSTVAKGPGTGPNETLTMQLPDYYAGSIIGTAGKGITLMQQKTGAHIHVSSRGHYVPGTTNRMVTITGTADACLQAQDLIIDAISAEDERRKK
ncbi:hypothetical protein ACOME3_002358 [Neoechinorhynchus agilis]